MLDQFLGILEIRKSVQHLSSGKAPGADTNPVEVCKAIDYPWIKDVMPQEFKDVSIIHLYKGKGNPQVCDNHRSISVLAITGKIPANSC